MEVEDAIKKAKNNNQGAYKFLLDTFWPYVYAFQLKRTANENDAEDITIQTFSKAFDKIHTYNTDYNFKTWLIAISKNLHIDLVRKQHTSVLTSDKSEQKTLVNIVDDAPTPEDHLIAQQNLASLLKVIRQLKPHYQEVLTLRYFKEFSYREISETLDEPMSNVKVKLMRAKKLLAQIINNNDF